MTNQEPKPSPGPWRFTDNWDPRCQAIYDSNDERIALAFESYNAELGLAESVLKANARLIAQAPETAELLRELAGACRHMKHDLQTRGGEVELRGMQLAEAVYELWLAPTLEKIAKLEGGGE